MKTFNAPSVSLQAPPEWTDASTYILAGEKINGFRVTVIVNVAPLKAVDLERHVDRQLQELQTSLQRFHLLSRQAVVNAPAGLTATIEIAWSQTNGSRVQQRQMFVQFLDKVYCLTATAPADAFAKVAAQFEIVMNTFKPKLWSE